MLFSACWELNRNQRRAQLTDLWGWRAESAVEEAYCGDLHIPPTESSSAAANEHVCLQNDIAVAVAKQVTA